MIYFLFFTASTFDNGEELSVLCFGMARYDQTLFFNIFKEIKIEKRIDSLVQYFWIPIF